MNLPDKIDMTPGTYVDYEAIGEAINQLIDYLAEKESEHEMTTNTQVDELMGDLNNIQLYIKSIQPTPTKQEEKE